MLAGISAGRGNLMNCIVGSYTLTCISNGMTLLKIPQLWQNVVFGAVIILTIIVNYLLARATSEERQFRSSKAKGTPAGMAQPGA